MIRSSSIASCSIRGAGIWDEKFLHSVGSSVWGRILGVGDDGAAGTAPNARSDPPLFGDRVISLIDRGSLLGGDGDELLRHATGDQLVRMILGDELAVVALQLLIADAGLTPSTW